MAIELWEMGAADLAGVIAKGEASARDVVQAHMDRIEAVNPAVNAITVVLTESALAAADAADAALAGGEQTGPLHGVPVTVKENIDLAGSATTQGLKAFAEMQPAIDAPHVAQIKAAGAIPIARTNLPDFGLRWHTDNELRGPTRNPWDAGRTAGGSSGGDAAALATGMTPLGLGNDYGGSLRVPAHFCGICSIKPTTGRVPSATAFQPEDVPITLQLMAVQGPMARRVSDLRMSLAAMSGPDARDPWWTPAPLDGPAVPRRVAVWRAGDDAQVDAGIDRAARALAEAGYDPVDVEPPMIDEAAQTWRDLVLSDSRMLMQFVDPLFGKDASAFLESTFVRFPDLDKAAYIQGFIARQTVARAWSRFQSEYPIVLGPVCTRRPFAVGRDLEDPEGVLETMRLTVAINLMGLPSAAVPVGESEGLPQGVQLIGPRFREDVCLDAAQAVEDGLGVLTPIDPR